MVDEQGGDACLPERGDPGAGELFGVLAAVVVEVLGVVCADGGVDEDELCVVVDDGLEVVVGWGVGGDVVDFGEFLGGAAELDEQPACGGWPHLEVDDGDCPAVPDGGEEGDVGDECFGGFGCA